VRARLAVAAVGSIGLVALLAAAYPHDPVAGWDVALARWVGASLPAPVEWLARPFGWLGGGVGMAVLAVAGAGVLIQRGRRGDAAGLVLAYVSSEVASQLLKLAFDRPRPRYDPAVELPTTAAFPSGHAAVSAAVLLVVAVTVGGRRAVRFAIVGTFAVGLSRIALGVHWTSDVVAGWALGACLASVILLARGVRLRGR
jgi:undecaprenyl-diphosphatase